MPEDSLPTLSTEETIRYSRQMVLPELGLVGQRRLKGARVLIVGLGGLGSPAALYLTAAGVGTIGLAEFDKVEHHNLQRQILHDTEWIHRSKLDSAITRLKALNPHCTLHRHPEGILVDNALELFAQYDLILDGSDNFPTRYLVNDTAYFARRPLVYGSIFQFEGQISFFNPTVEPKTDASPCYRCLFPKMPEPDSVPNCEQAGVLGALCGTVGSLQAMEAIKYLSGVGTPLQGRLLVVETLSMNFRILKIKQDPHCPICGDVPSITNLQLENYQWSCHPDTADSQPGSETDTDDFPMETSINEAQTWLESDNPPLLLDVRETFEIDICKLPNSIHISTGKVPHRLDALPKNYPILIYCHHGIRSRKITQFLRAKGYNQATSMIGGIHAWAEKVDPSMQRY